jgi:hypothetical protein
MPLYLPDVRAGGKLEVWGCVRPAPVARRQTGQTQVAEVQFRSATASSFVTLTRVRLKPGDCYFDIALRFPSAGLVRLRWVDPKGVAMFSRTVSLG